MPRKVVDGYMQMPDPWRHVKGSRSEHRYDMQVLHPVLDLGGSTVRFGGGSLSMPT
jgi:hypothetical protein